MIQDPEELSEVVIQALISYESARRAKISLNHNTVYEHCRESLTYCAIASLMVVGEPRVRGIRAIEWVKNLPKPNGLFPNLIEAFEELSPQSVPFLNFIVGIPRSTQNISLVEDALEELLDNIENYDEEGTFTTILPGWQDRIG